MAGPWEKYGGAPVASATPKPWDKYGAAPGADQKTHDGYPARKNSDGSYSTELSITVTDPRVNGGKPTNIPSLWKGQEVDQDTAIQNALASGKPYTAFGSIPEAVQAAKARSAAGGAAAPAGPPPSAGMPRPEMNEWGAADTTSAALKSIPGAGLLGTAAEGIWNSAAKIPAGFAGLAGTVLPGPEGQGADWVERVKDFLSVAPTDPDTIGDPLFQGLRSLLSGAGKVVDPAAHAVESGVRKLPEGAQTALAAGGEAAMDIANVVPVVAGAGAVSRATRAAANTTETAAAARRATTPKEVTRDAGFVTRPSDRQAAGESVGIWDKTKEAVAGSRETGRGAILKNLEGTERLAREELGVAPGTTLTDDVYSGVEAPHAASYRAIEDLPSMDFDQKLIDDLQALGSGNPLTETSPAIAKLRDEILQGGVAGASGKTLRQKISDLRQLARDNLATGSGEQVVPRDRTLGKAQIGAAEALEGLLERKVPENLVEDYRKARRTFAVTNMLRRATTLGERIDPSVIARESELNPAIKGRMGVVADQASRYPKVFTANVPEPVSGAQGLLGRIGAGAVAGGSAGSLFGPVTAMGGAAGGMLLPKIAERSLLKTNPVPDLASAAPQYFRSPVKSADPFELAPPPGGALDVLQGDLPFSGSATQLDLDMRPMNAEPPASGFPGGPDARFPKDPQLPLAEADGNYGPLPLSLEDELFPTAQLSDALPWENPFEVGQGLRVAPDNARLADGLTYDGQPPGLDPVGMFEFDTIGLNARGAGQPLQPAAMSLADELGLPARSASELQPQAASVPNKPKGVTGPRSAQLSDPRPQAGFEVNAPARDPFLNDYAPGTDDQLLRELGLADDAPLPAKGDVTDALPSQGTEKFPDRYKRPEATRKESDDGYISYVDEGDAWRIDDAFVKAEARGKGKGQAQLVDLAKEAQDAAKVLNSDKKVTADQRRVYEKLKAAGKLTFEGPFDDGGPVFRNIRPAE